MYTIARKQIPLALAVLCGAAIALVAFGAGLVFAPRMPDGVMPTLSGGSAPPQDVDFSPVWKAWGVINDKFVPAAVATSTKVATSTEEMNQEKVWGMIEGLAASLNDPYTFFLPPPENQQFTDDMSGAFEGVGMEIAVRDQVLTVVSPLKGTPAEKAGLKSKDQILKIDGESTQGLDVNAAVRKIRGPKGSIVTLTVFRSGWSEPREIKVMRDVINVPTLSTTAREDGVFVIQLMSFTANSPELFRNALREFVRSGDTKLVLDLRGNPGGYLEAAVEMGSWFLQSGKVIVTEDYAGHAPNIVHRSLGYDIFNKNLRMVVLVDHGSASAAEILADALHHYRIATMVGDNTFGKGSVQELVDIANGSALKITVARWLGPDGEQIPREGIIPDVRVEFTDKDKETGRDPQMDRAVEILRNGL
jgi:carboxyl-terminal processing protease